MRHCLQDPVVTAQGVSVDYGTLTVFEGVDLTVHAGEFVGLLGPNGAGKTTLLRALLGLIPARAGAVEIAERTGKAATVQWGTSRNGTLWPGIFPSMSIRWCSAGG